MVQYIVLGVIIIYSASSLICLGILCFVDFGKPLSRLQCVIGTIYSLTPVLNTRLLIKETYNHVRRTNRN